MKDNLNLYQIKDDFNIYANGSVPQYFYQWKTTLFFGKLVYDINYFGNGRQPKSLINGR